MNNPIQQRRNRRKMQELFLQFLHDRVTAGCERPRAEALYDLDLYCRFFCHKSLIIGKDPQIDITSEN